MRILFLCQYFPPEMGAPSARTHEHARQWVADGHQVTVLTGFPNHPTGIVPPEYRGRLFQSESLDGIRVWRTWFYTTPNERFTRRIASYLSFMVSAILAAALRRADYDMVVATSPQFFVAVAGFVVARLKRKPLGLEIRDLWPEGIVAVGLLRRDARVTRMLEWLERFLYRQADCIVTVTESFRRDMIARGIDGAKIHTVRAGADVDRFAPGPRDNEVRRELGLGDRFLASYVGTHGMTQGLGTVLEAARLLRDRDDIHFLFVGEGADKKHLIEQRDALGLTNVTFVDQQPKERMPLFLAASDTLLVPLRRHELFEGTIPSKLFEGMASGRPVLLGVQGEAAEILREANAGIALEPENSAAMAAAIAALADDPQRRRALGEAGTRYVRARCARSVLARRMLEALRSHLDSPAVLAHGHRPERPAAALDEDVR
jgi:glycosyltransferase involved in cell wall biosynthesis